MHGLGCVYGTWEVTQSAVRYTQAERTRHAIRVRDDVDDGARAKRRGHVFGIWRVRHSRSVQIIFIG